MTYIRTTKYGNFGLINNNHLAVISSGVATVGPSGALAPPSASVAPPSGSQFIT